MLTLNKGLVCMEQQCREAYDRFRREEVGSMAYRDALYRYKSLRDKIRKIKNNPNWNPDERRNMRLERVKRKACQRAKH